MTKDLKLSITVGLSPDTLKLVDKKRGTTPRSEFLRELIINNIHSVKATA